MYNAHMNENEPLPPIQFPVSYGEQDENGVDLSLIRSMLELSPQERADRMSKFCRDTYWLYEYGRRHREARSFKSS
jgi:hypothetical protein